jgi:hypothetical protein
MLFGFCLVDRSVELHDAKGRFAGTVFQWRRISILNAGDLKSLAVRQHTGKTTPFRQKSQRLSSGRAFAERMLHRTRHRLFSGQCRIESV